MACSVSNQSLVESAIWGFHHTSYSSCPLARFLSNAPGRNSNDTGIKGSPLPQPLSDSRLPITTPHLPLHHVLQTHRASSGRRCVSGRRPWEKLTLPSRSSRPFVRYGQLLQPSQLLRLRDPTFALCLACSGVRLQHQHTSSYQCYIW